MDNVQSSSDSVATVKVRQIIIKDGQPLEIKGQWTTKELRAAAQYLHEYADNVIVGKPLEDGD